MVTSRSEEYLCVCDSQSVILNGKEYATACWTASIQPVDFCSPLK